MTALSALLTSVTAQAKPTKPPLPEGGLERIQAQWADLTDDPFDFGSIQRLLNIAKSAGGGVRTLGVVFDEVHLSGHTPENLTEQIETRLRGRLAITTAPPQEGTRRGHATVYNAPVPEPIDPGDNFACLVAFARCLGVQRTIYVNKVAVPMTQVAIREGVLCINDQPATEFYHAHRSECVIDS